MSMRRILIMICIVYPVILLAQTPKLTESTEEDFKSCQRREVAFVKSEEIVKVDGTISVKTKKGTVSFKDDLTEENYRTYEYVGDLIQDKIALIMTQDLHTDRYIAIDLSTGDQKVLIGFPHVYVDKIVCLQGAETDSYSQIELWTFNDGKLIKSKSFGLGRNIYPADIVWRNENEILIEDSTGKFWKTKMEATGS